MCRNQANVKIESPLLRFAPFLWVGALLIVVALLGLGRSSPVAAQNDMTAPTISAIALTSDPDDDVREHVPYRARGFTWNVRPSGIYGIGDAIEVRVTFNEDVTFSGTPKLDLNLGGAPKAAEYLRTEDSAVVFSYTVAEGDSDMDGVAIEANKLKLNGGSIRDGAGNDADLTHDALAAQTNHQVDGIRPRISLRLMNTTWGADGFHTAGESIWVEVKALNGDTAYASVTGPPQLMLNFDGKEKAAEWDSTNLGELFTCVVQVGDLDTNGVAINADSISLNGGFIKDEAGNDAILTHSALAANSQILIDAVVPTVSSIAITSDPGEDDTYSAGDKIEITVTFSENVTVPAVGRSGSTRTHRPRLELNIGAEAKTADYQSHQGAAVVFAYNVQAGDSDEDGISIGANKLYLDGGLILDAAGNNPISATLSPAQLPLDAVVSHDAAASDPNHKVGEVTAAEQQTQHTNSPATGAPTISGTAQVGQTLTAITSDISDADGLIRVSYSNQWLADDTAIDGATSSTYTLQASDNGKVIKVRVTFTDDAGNDESLSSVGTAAVVMGGL